MSVFRQILLGFAAGGIVLYTWSLVSYGVFALSLTSIIALIVSVIVVVGLVALFAATAYKVVHTSDSWMWFVATVALLVVNFIALTFVLNWGVGASIRSLSFWSFLPRGNLFEAGGRAGWTYLVLLVLLIAALLSSKAKTFGKSRFSKFFVKRTKEEAVARKEAKATKSERKTSDEDLRDLLTPR